MLKKKADVILICLWSVFGVFGSEFVSVTEGDSVTLSVILTETQRKEGISWKFGPQNITIAEIEVEDNIIRVYDKDRADGRFRDRLKLDHSGSLTITNTRTTDAGLYQLINTNKKTQLNIFNLTVYAPLPVPVISKNSSQCSSSSSSNCSLLCSVLNVRDVSLSWYKGNSLLSSISVSHLNIRLSLSLEVEYQDTNTYRCVLNNPITNQTQHLNINELCQPCSDMDSHRIVVICSGVVGSLMIVVAVLMVWIYRKHTNSHQQVQGSGEEIIYADTTFHKRQTHKPGAPVEDDVVYAGVMSR